MIYSFLLVVHIGGGIVTGIAASYAGVVLWQRTSALYRACALILGALAAFEVFSGVVLAFISLKITAQSLCNNVALYLLIVFFVETLLFIRMRKVSISFPLAQTLIPVVASLALMVAAVSYGL